MYQSWRSLSFLHWKFDPAAIQKLIPDGLTVDTFEGSTYVGIVAFTMSSVRLSWLPSVPGTSPFHEINVRTYVVDGRGRPGVWFFSLEASNGLMAHVARRWYRLPYNCARMEVESQTDSVRYESDRLCPDPVPASCRIETCDYGTQFLARPGTLEFFLAERYYLFAQSNGRLFSGQVYHVPYPLRTAECTQCDETLLQRLKIKRPEEAPIAHFSPGVDVEVFSLRPL